MTEVTINNIGTLTETELEGLLSAGMSIAVYDTDENRVAYVWSMSDVSELSFTQYNYDANGDLAYTLTGASRAEVEAVTGIDVNTVGSLNESDIAALLSAGMSLAIYDTANNRIDHAWSMDDAGEVSRFADEGGERKRSSNWRCSRASTELVGVCSRNNCTAGLRSPWIARAM